MSKLAGRPELFWPESRRCSRLLRYHSLDRRKVEFPDLFVRDRDSIRPLLQNECLLCVRKLRCLHRLPLLPARRCYRGKLHFRTIQCVGIRAGRQSSLAQTMCGQSSLEKAELPDAVDVGRAFIQHRIDFRFKALLPVRIGEITQEPNCRIDRFKES